MPGTYLCMAYEIRSYLWVIFVSFSQIQSSSCVDCVHVFTKVTGADSQQDLLIWTRFTRDWNKKDMQKKKH